MRLPSSSQLAGPPLCRLFWNCGSFSPWNSRARLSQDYLGIWQVNILPHSRGSSVVMTMSPADICSGTYYDCFGHRDRVRQWWDTRAAGGCGRIYPVTGQEGMLALVWRGAFFAQAQRCMGRTERGLVCEAQRDQGERAPGLTGSEARSLRASTAIPHSLSINASTHVDPSSCHLGQGLGPKGRACWRGTVERTGLLAVVHGDRLLGHLTRGHGCPCRC